MKIYSDRAKLPLYRNVFILLEIIIYLPNKSHKRLSFVNTSLIKIASNSIKIHAHTHFIFSLEWLAFSLYNYIFNLIPANKVCQKNDHLWKSHILENLKILTSKFKSTQFFWIFGKNNICMQNFMKIRLKTRFFDNFFTFWKWPKYLHVVKKNSI